MPTVQAYKPAHEAIVQRLVDTCHGQHHIAITDLKPEDRAVMARMDMAGTLSYTISVLSNLISESEIPTDDIPAVITRLQAAGQKLKEAKLPHVALSQAIKNLQGRI
jgi:hypothetical protein